MHPRECDCASCAPGCQLAGAGGVREDPKPTLAGYDFTASRRVRQQLMEPYWQERRRAS